MIIERVSIKISKHPKGLSLLEALMAILILAVALGSIGYMYATARGNVDSLGKQRIALGLAQAKMEGLRATSYDELIGGNDRILWPPESSVSGSNIYRVWTVDPASGDSTSQDYKLITLDVYLRRSGGNWPDGQSIDIDASVKPDVTLKCYAFP